MINYITGTGKWVKRIGAQLSREVNRHGQSICTTLICFTTGNHVVFVYIQTDKLTFLMELELEFELDLDFVILARVVSKHRR